MPRRALLLLVAAAVQTSTAAAQELTYGGTLQYSTGKYIFTEPTDTWSFTSALTLTAGPLRLGAYVPVIAQMWGWTSRRPHRVRRTGAGCRAAGAEIPFIALTTAALPEEVRAAHRSHPAGVVLKLYSTVMWSTMPWTKWGFPSPASGMKQMRP